MRKKFFATAVGLALGAIMLTGCGKSEDVATNGYIESTGPAVTADEPTGVAETDAAAASTSDENASQGLADVTGENDDFGQVPEEDQIPWDEPDDEEVVAETGVAEGIIVMQVDYASNWAAPTFTVNAIDPQTGNYHTVSSFAFYSGETESISSAYDKSLYFNYRDIFNDDFTLMAATKTFLSNEESHAGWVDQSGEFFDVTIALGEQAQNDFEPAKHYRAVGFTADGNFIYVDAEDKVWPTYYMVSLNNMAPGASFEIDYTDIHIMSGHYGDSTWDWIGNARQTCWVDDDRFLATTFEKQVMACQLITISTQTVVDIVPRGSQSSWSPVLAPDGNTVAFMSAPMKGNDNPSVYLTDLSGNGTPTKLETTWEPLSSRGAGVLPYIGTSYYYACILEWR